MGRMTETRAGTQAKRAGARPAKPGGDRRPSIEQWAMPTPERSTARRQTKTARASKRVA